MKTIGVVLLAALPLFIAAACGGSVVSTGDGNNGDGGSGGGGDGGGGSGGGCLATMPTSGGACSPNGLECEYGTSNGRCNNPIIDCDNGKWTEPPPTPGPYCPPPSSSGCPASKSDITPGVACGDTDLDCEYPDGRCACSEQQSGPVQVNPDGGMIPREWRCETPQAGCPAARPRVGSGCPKPGQTCDYGSCTLPDGVQIDCDSAGRWEFADFACAD